MIEQTTLHNILTWIIAVILFIFQSLDYFISQIKKIVKHGQKNTTVVTTDTIILSESNPNNNNAPENVITVQGLIQKHFDIPLIIAEDEPKVNDFIKNAQLLTSYDNYKEKKKTDQFMEHLVDDSYVARGLGLITANVGREAEFYLYSKYDNNFENVVIKLKGRQGEIGQITIPNQNPTNSIETKSIPMDYFYDEDRIKVTYTPFAEGVYTLILVRNGLSICRSPYYISVEKSPINSRSQIRLGTKKYKMVTKFAKAKHVPLETCDNSIPLIEPSKPSISRNILPTPEENSIRTDVMSIVTKFESNSIHFQKNDQKHTVNKSKKSTKTDLFDKNSISADSNTQIKIETGNDYDTNINDLSSLSISSNFKSNDEKCSSNLDVSNRNSKSNYVNSIEIESNLVNKSNKKLDESIRNINDIPRVKNMSSNHLETTNSVLLKESLNDKSSDDVEKHNQTYKTNEPILGQNQIETFLDPTIVDKFEIKCIDNEAYTHNEVSCFDDDERKTVIVKKNINELKTYPNISMNRQFTDSTQYNINTPFTSILTKITNDVCEKCSIKVLRILSEFPRDINITHNNNNSNENCSSFETLLAQPISININIDNLFEKPISPTNEHKTDNLLTDSLTNKKLMDTIDKDIKYHYINEIKPIDTTFNEIYCDINNTTTELMVKQNKHDGEINKTINDKITNNFTIPLTKNNIDKPKTDHIENILSTDNKMQIQVQNVQKSSEHNMDIDKTNQIQFHEYINNELNDTNKENGKILDTCDNIVTIINNGKKSNEELVTKELKAKNVIISDEYKNIQSSFINSQTVLASMEDKLPTSRYKPKDIRQEIRNIPNTNVILSENQKLIIENSIEPVLKNFKNKMVEKITQLYLNKGLTSSENTSILENYNINLTNNLQKNQLHNHADKNKTKLIETIRSQLKNHFHKNNIPEMILNNKKTDNNQLYKYLENIIKTNMNPNEIHSQRLDEINFQTLVSIAKNQLNKQQLDNEFKIMTLENVTPNFEIKITNDDEKVQDTEIKLKNISNDTSTNIEATNKSIKSNTSEETDVESNIDNKKKGELIKLKNKVNDLRKIQNMFKINEIGENNNRDTTIKSKPTKNASIEQIKKQEDLTIEKENIHKFPHLYINENFNNSSSAVILTVNKENETSTIIDTSPVTEIKLDTMNNSAQSDTSTLINPSIKPQVQKIVVEIVTNNNKTIVDSVAIIIHEETEENKQVAKKNTPKTNYWIQINDHEVYTINAYHDTLKPIDKDKVTETEMPKISIRTDITIDNNFKESNKKEIEESIKNDIIIETPTIPVQKTEKVTNINQTKVIQYTDSSTEHMKEPIDFEIIYKQKILKNDVQTNKTKQNFKKENESCLLINTSNFRVEQNNIIGKRIEHPILIENSNESVKESKVIKATTENELIKNSNSLALNKEEATGKEDNPETEIERGKSINKTIKEGEAISLIKIPTFSDDEKIIIEKTAKNQLRCSPDATPTVVDEEKRTIVETTERPLLNDKSTKSIEIEKTPNTDSPTINVEELIDKDIIPETETQTEKSTDNLNKENETCSPEDTSTTSYKEKIILEEPAENPLPNEPSIKSVEIEPTPNTDSPTVNVEEPIDKDIIPETTTQTEKSEAKFFKGGEPCSPTDISTTSDEGKKILEVTEENPLPNRSPIKSIEVEATPNTDSSIANVEEPIYKDIIPETETQTEKSTDKMITESETYSSANTSTGSVEEKITIVETTEKPLRNEPPIKSVEFEATPNTDSSIANVEEPIYKDIIPETEKSTDKMITESETCSSANTSTGSVEEKITIVETTEKTLLNGPPIKSVDESKVVDINTESESILNNDSSIANVEEPIDKDIIPETETKTEKSEDTIYKDGEPCSPTDIPTTSDEGKKILEETAENPLPNGPSIKSVEVEATPNTDSSIANVEEPIDNDIIPETETQTEKSEDKIYKDGEPCFPTDIPTTSDDEKKILEETEENPLLNGPPIKSIEVELTPNTDSSIANVEEPIYKDIIPETEKSTDKMITESETCSSANTSTGSVEEKITIVETTEKTLLNGPPIKSVDESKVVDINTESESILNNDSSIANVEEPNVKDIIPETTTQTEKSEDKIYKDSEPCSPTDISTTSDEGKKFLEETEEDPLPNGPSIKSVEVEATPNTDSSIANVEEPIYKDIIPETETQTEKSTDKMITESETCSSANTSTGSVEEKITIVETTEKPLRNEPPIKSVEFEATPNTDSSIANVEEPIDKDIIPETETKTEKSEDTIYKDGEPCSPTDIPTTSDEGKKILEETAENPLPNGPSIKSVEVEATPNTDSSIANVEEPIDNDIIPETETKTEKSEDTIYKDSEPCSPTDIPTTSDEGKKILEETAENPLPNGPSIKSVEVEATPNTDSSIANVEEPIDNDIIPETETQTEKSEDKIYKDGEPCSPTDIPTTSDDEKKILEETEENPLLNGPPIKSIEVELTPNTDSSIANVEEPIDNDIIPETETQTEKSEDKIYKDGEPCSPTDIPTTSDDEKKILEETEENPLLNGPPIKSIEVELTPNTDSSIANVEEPIDKDIIPETETKTEKSEDTIYKDGEPCSPADIPTTSDDEHTPTVSDDENIIMEETIENPLPNEPLIKSVEELKVLDINTGYELFPNNDSIIANVEEPFNKDNVPETQFETVKTIDNIEMESETCSHTDTSSFSIDEKNIIDETISNPLPIETLIKSIEEVTVVDINTESKSILNNNSSIANVEEPIDKDIISEAQTEKSTDNINIESDPCSPFSTPTVSDKEMIMIVEATEKILLNETPIKSFNELKVVDINTETEPSPNTDSLTVNVEALIDKENIREIQIETDKLIDNSNKECESCFPTDKLTASDEENNLTKKTIEILSPIEISMKFSIKAFEESKVKKINTETVFVPNIDSLTVNAEEPLDEDYFSKIVIKTDKTLDSIVKECETCPPVDTSIYVTEEIKGIDGTIEKLIPIGPSFVVVETENLTSIDGFNTIVNRQSGSQYLKDIESSTRIDTAAFVKDQKEEENETVIENILTINTSTASVQEQIQVEEVIKDETVILNNDSVKFDEMSPEEQKKIETAEIVSITVMEEQTDINRGDVIYTCEGSLDKTIVEKGIHSETTSTIDILAAVVEEQRALEIEVSEYATQVLNDTSTETIVNLIKTKKNTENETTTPIVVAKSEVERNEIKIMNENKTSTPVHLASTNTKQIETDMVTEIASPNVNTLNNNTKIILIDKEMKTENSNNPKHSYLKFGETSKIHSLENEDNLPGKSYGIQKLEMSVQRMKTSNEDYYEKTFLQLEQTEKISVENKDKVDCENKNIIDDKLYTVNESDLNAILCASSLEEALTLLDSKIKFKFKHRKLSNKANSAPHIPKFQTSESRSSGTNTNFTDAREFFKEIEKKCKK